jgi:hypothetical protein
MITRKVILSGDYIEVYEYQKPVSEGYTRKERKQKEPPKDFFELLELQEEENEEKIRSSFSISRTQNTIRRLINCNFRDYKKLKFITLTFEKKVTDIKEANYFLKLFFRKLKNHLNLSYLKYICVLEFQKNGRVHYHILTECQYLQNKKVRELWGQGFVNIRGFNDLKQIRNVGAYICKYLTKETLDNRFFGQKAFQCSKGLIKPLQIINKLSHSFEATKKELIFEKTFDNEYTGMVNYKQYRRV